MKRITALAAILAALTGITTLVMAGAQKTGGSSVANGGTGATTFTDGGILIGNGADAIVAAAVLTNGQLLVGDGTTDPTAATLTGTANQLTVTNGAGSITLSIPSSFTLATASPTFSQVTAAVVGNATTATALAADPAGCASGQYVVDIGASGIGVCGTINATTPVNAGTAPISTDWAFDHAALGSAHAATAANTASAIVARDALGSFVMGVASGTLYGNATTATALAANPADCTNQYATSIGADGALGCAEVNPAYVSAGALASDVYVSSYAAGSIINADISGSAAIADSKLATISTAGKVDGAALTGTAPVTFKLFSSADCNNLSAAATGQLCVDTSSWDLWLSTSATAGGDYKKIGP